MPQIRPDLLKQFYEQLTQFEKTMEDLSNLKQVSKYLRVYREMLKIKRYD